MFCLLFVCDYNCIFWSNPEVDFLESNHLDDDGPKRTRYMTDVVCRKCVFHSSLTAFNLLAALARLFPLFYRNILSHPTCWVYSKPLMVMLTVAPNNKLQQHMGSIFVFHIAAWFCDGKVIESQMCVQILFQAVEGTWWWTNLQQHFKGKYIHSFSF